jgi:hypothetical protein
MKSVFEGICIVNAEPSGGAECEAPLVLIETYEQYLLLLGTHSLIFRGCCHVRENRLLFK